MTDRILATIAMGCVVAYFLPLIFTVPEPALIVVLCLVTLMAVYDFVRDLRNGPDRQG